MVVTSAIVDYRCDAYRKRLMKDKWLRAEYQSLISEQVTTIVDKLVAEYRLCLLSEIRKRKRAAEIHSKTRDMFD